MLWLEIPVGFDHDVVGITGECLKVVDAEFGLFEGLEWPLVHVPGLGPVRCRSGICGGDAPREGLSEGVLVVVGQFTAGQWRGLYPAHTAPVRNPASSAETAPSGGGSEVSRCRRTSPSGFHVCG